MRLTSQELNDLVVELAKEQFGDKIFKRRQLMLAAEKRVREVGAWTSADDLASSSVGIKSEGLAKIDWAITHLHEQGRLTKDGRDRWRLP
jgi:hypothetical protein